MTYEMINKDDKRRMKRKPATDGPSGRLG